MAVLLKGTDELQRAFDLSQFLRIEAGRPFAWGWHDCALVLADWWQFMHGDDPAAALRGTYSTEAECAEILKRAGGLPALVQSIADKAGAVRVHGEPPVGAFGVIEVKGRSFAAIRSGTSWAIKAPSGIAFVNAPAPARVWSI